MVVFHSFHNLRTTNIHLINTASIILIPKKNVADKVAHYRPTSLIHGIRRVWKMDLKDNSVATGAAFE